MVLSLGFTSIGCVISHFPPQTVFIPFPIRMPSPPVSISPVGQKVKIFISINKSRHAYKGTDVLLTAALRLVEKHAEEVELVKAESVPLPNTNNWWTSCDLILDQLYSYIRHLWIPFWPWARVSYVWVVESQRGMSCWIWNAFATYNKRVARRVEDVYRQLEKLLPTRKGWCNGNTKAWTTWPNIMTTWRWRNNMWSFIQQIYPTMPHLNKRKPLP